MSKSIQLLTVGSGHKVFEILWFDALGLTNTEELFLLALFLSERWHDFAMSYGGYFHRLNLVSFCTECTSTTCNLLLYSYSCFTSHYFSESHSKLGSFTCHSVNEIRTMFSKIEYITLKMWTGPVKHSASLLRIEEQNATAFPLLWMSSPKLSRSTGPLNIRHVW